MPSIYQDILHTKMRQMRRLYGTGRKAEQRQLIAEIKSIVTKMHEDNAVRDKLAQWSKAHA